MKKNAAQGGFTLLELLVVIVIIGLLAGIVAPNLFRQLGSSEVTTARAQMDALVKALDQYRLEMGHYPTTSQGLDALVRAPAGEARWRGPYLRKEVPLDPWDALCIPVSRARGAGFCALVLGQGWSARRGW